MLAKPINSLSKSAIVKSVCETELSRAADLSFPNLWDKLDGNWYLKYTNNGPIGNNKSNSLIYLKDVIQRIDSETLTVDHILKFDGIIRGNIILHHSVSVVSERDPSMLFIELNGISTEGPFGSLNFPVIKLIPQEYFQSGYFETSYVDEELRISRGVRGELRVFFKEKETEKKTDFKISQ